jgi:hypothetical protein
VDVLPFTGASPKHLDSPGYEIHLGDEGFLLFILVLEEGRGSGDNCVFPILEIGEGVGIRIVGPIRSNDIQEPRGVRNPFRGVEGPFLGGDVVNKEKTNGIWSEIKWAVKALAGPSASSSLRNSLRASAPEEKWILAWGSREAISLSQRLV